MRAAVDGDLERAREIAAELAPAYELMRVTTNPIPIKAALNLLGHEVGGYRLPLVPPTADELERVRDCLGRASACLVPAQSPLGNDRRWLAAAEDAGLLAVERSSASTTFGQNCVPVCRDIFERRVTRARRDTGGLTSARRRHRRRGRSGPERDLVAREPVGVALTVDALV